MSWQEEELAKRKKDQVEKAERDKREAIRAEKVKQLWSKFLEVNRNLPAELQMPVERQNSEDGKYCIESIVGKGAYKHGKTHRLFANTTLGLITFTMWVSAAGSGIDCEYIISYDVDDNFYFMRMQTFPEDNTRHYRKGGYGSRTVDDRVVELIIQNLCTNRRIDTGCSV